MSRGRPRVARVADADTKPNAVFHHQEHSPTAASIGSEVSYPNGGMQLYRVTVANGSALSFVDVEASGGDDAATKALQANPGLKVAHVEPAPQKKAA